MNQATASHVSPGEHPATPVGHGSAWLLVGAASCAAVLSVVMRVVTG